MKLFQAHRFDWNQHGGTAHRHHDADGKLQILVPVAVPVAGYDGRVVHVGLLVRGTSPFWTSVAADANCDWLWQELPKTMPNLPVAI